MPSHRKRKKANVFQPFRAHLKKRVIIKASAMVISAFTFWFIGQYSYPKLFLFEIPPLRFQVYALEFLPWNEEEQIRVSIENKHNNDVQVRARLSGSVIPIFIGEQNGANIFFNGMIHRGEQIQRQILVFFPFDLDRIGDGGQIVGLSLWASIDSQDFGPKEIPIRLAPFPFHKSLFKICGLVFVAIGLSAIGDWKKKMDILGQLAQWMGRLRGGGIF